MTRIKDLYGTAEGVPFQNREFPASVRDAI